MSQYKLQPYSLADVEKVQQSASESANHANGQGIASCVRVSTSYAEGAR